MKKKQKKPYKELMKQKVGSLKNKINRPPGKLTKMRKEKSQISKVRNAKGEKTNTMEVQDNQRLL
jgi:hypothetical protein